MKKTNLIIGIAAAIILASCAKEAEKVSTITIFPDEAELMEGESLELTAIIDPEDAEYGQINWSSSDASIATVSSDGTVSGVCAGTVTITAKVDGTSGSAEITVEHAGVQLWEYGPYWATYNLGAGKPEDIGQFFSWGNITGYAPEGLNFSYTFKKSTYASTPGADLFEDIPQDAQYDAAIANWGDNWRMPSMDELNTLLNFDFSDRTDGGKWVSDYNGSGISGIIISGTGEYSSRSIFLPAAGYGYGTVLNNANISGYYWSSSFDDLCFDAKFLTFVKGGGKIPDDTFDVYRYYGYPIRPVADYAPGLDDIL